MSRVGLGLLLATVLGAAFIGVGGDGSPARDIGGVLLVAAGPIALVATLIAVLTSYVGPIERVRLNRTVDGPPNGVEAMALCLAVGLAMLALGVLLLDVLSVDIEPASLHWWLLGADAVCVAICWSRTVGRRPAQRWSGNLSVPLATAASVLLLGGGLAIGIVITKPPRPAQGIVGYTVLGLSPVDGDAVALHVQNLEATAKTYRLSFSVGPRTAPDMMFTIAPGQVWERRLDLGPYGGRRDTVRVSLFTPSGSRMPYRSVDLEPRTL
jgi:hypothetical protein